MIFIIYWLLSIILLIYTVLQKPEIIPDAANGIADVFGIANKIGRGVIGILTTLFFVSIIIPIVIYAKIFKKRGDK